MNRTITTYAERARARIVTTRPTRRPRPPAPLPLPLLAALWRPVPVSAPGVWGWRSFRWPLNGTRRAMARTWPRRWTGRRHPLPHLAARIVWTLTATTVALTALAAAAALTAAMAAVWTVGHLIGVGLILAGWFPPLSTRHLEDHLATLTTTPPTTTPTTPAAPAPAGPGSTGTVAVEDLDPWDFNLRNDPWLNLEQARVDELRRLNDHLAAGGPTPVTGPAAELVPGAYHHRSPVAVRPLGWRVARAVVIASVLAGMSLYLASALLAFGSAIGAAPEPPTFDQIHAEIEQRHPTQDQQP